MQQIHLQRHINVLLWRISRKGTFFEIGRAAGPFRRNGERGRLGRFGRRPEGQLYAGRASRRLAGFGTRRGGFRLKAENGERDALGPGNQRPGSAKPPTDWINRRKTHAKSAFIAGYRTLSHSAPKSITSDAKKSQMPTLAL